MDYEILFIVGPVYPHAYVGFSGGSKYFFPGICGWNFIDITHWIGALNTNLKNIGFRDTPVRRLLEKAVTLIKIPTIYFNLVVDSEGIKGIFTSDDNDAWVRETYLSEKFNIKFVPKHLKRVISIPLAHYEDFRTGAKAIYKIEPIIADGGQIIVYAPNITEWEQEYNEDTAVIRSAGEVLYRTRG